MNDVGVNLAERDQWRRLSGFAAAFFRLAIIGSKHMQEGLAVSFDRGFGIVFGKSQIQRAAAIGTRNPSHAGGKSMDKPGNSAEVRSTEKIQLALPGTLGRHKSMLSEAIVFRGQRLQWISRGR